MGNPELREKADTLAYKYEKKYGGCPQCVLAAVKETVGGISDDVFKAATGLAGGVAVVGAGTCGALSGGVMALSTISAGSTRTSPILKKSDGSHSGFARNWLNNLRRSSEVGYAKTFKSGLWAGRTTCGTSKTTRTLTLRAATKTNVLWCAGRRHGG